MESLLLGPALASWLSSPVLLRGEPGTEPLASEHAVVTVGELLTELIFLARMGTGTWRIALCKELFGDFF